MQNLFLYSSHLHKLCAKPHQGEIMKLCMFTQFESNVFTQSLGYLQHINDEDLFVLLKWLYHRKETSDMCFFVLFFFVILYAKSFIKGHMFFDLYPFSHQTFVLLAPVFVHWERISIASYSIYCMSVCTVNLSVLTPLLYKKKRERDICWSIFGNT